MKALANTIADRILTVEGGHTGTHVHVMGEMGGEGLCYRTRSRQQIVEIIHAGLTGRSSPGPESETTAPAIENSPAGPPR